MHSLTLLNQEWTARGFHRKQTRRVLIEFALMVTMAVCGPLMFGVYDAWPMWVLGLWMSSYGSLGITTNCHTSSHNATSNSRLLNRSLCFFGYPVLMGLSGTYWYNKHIAVHHPTPNVVGWDDDIDLMPFFAINEDEYARSTGLRRWFFTWNWVLIPFAIALNGFNIQRQGWSYLLGALRDPSRRKATHWLDLALLGVHFAVWIFLPMLFFPAWGVIGVYVMRLVGIGYSVYIGFAPAHFPAEAYFLAQENSDRTAYFKSQDYILLQCATTVNFKTGPLGRLVCAGVDYQIEHHLFPGICHVYYPQMSPILERWCLENGYPYRRLGWAEAVWKSLVTFKTRKPVEPKLEPLRERPRHDDAGVALPARAAGVPTAIPPRAVTTELAPEKAREFDLLQRYAGDVAV